jgi:hypothetical protein
MPTVTRWPSICCPRAGNLRSDPAVRQIVIAPVILSVVEGSLSLREHPRLKEVFYESCATVKDDRFSAALKLMWGQPPSAVHAAQVHRAAVQRRNVGAPWPALNEAEVSRVFCEAWDSPGHTAPRTPSPGGAPDNSPARSAPGKPRVEATKSASADGTNSTALTR